VQQVGQDPISRLVDASSADLMRTGLGPRGRDTLGALNAVIQDSATPVGGQQLQQLISDILSGAESTRQVFGGDPSGPNQHFVPLPTMSMGQWRDDGTPNPVQALTQDPFSLLAGPGPNQNFVPLPSRREWSDFGTPDPVQAITQDPFDEGGTASALGGPTGEALTSAVLELLQNRGVDPTAGNLRFERARELTDTARQASLNQAQEALAQRGLASVPGIPQGQEGGAIRRIEERIAPEFAAAVRDILIDENQRSDERLFQGLTAGTNVSGLEQDALLNENKLRQDRFLQEGLFGQQQLLQEGLLSQERLLSGNELEQEQLLQANLLNQQQFLQADKQAQDRLLQLNELGQERSLRESELEQQRLLQEGLFGQQRLLQGDELEQEQLLQANLLSQNRFLQADKQAQDRLLQERELEQDRFMGGLEGALDLAGFNEDRLLGALSLATGLSEVEARTMLDSIGTATDRQAVLSDIALRSLDQNIAFNQFLAEFSLNRAVTLETLQSGRIDDVQQLLAQFQAFLDVARTGQVVD